MADISVVIVDDDTLVRRALSAYVSAADGMEVVGEAEDGRTAVDVVVRRAPDVVLMDIRMPQMNGVDATIAIGAQRPGSRILALTTFATAESVVPILRAGAAGYLLKDATPAEITDAIRVVHEGSGVLSPRVTRDLIAALRTTEQGVMQMPTESEKLSIREAEIVEHLALGESNSEIARALHVSEGTVKAHLSNVMQKWNARDRVQVLIAAAKFGLIIFR